ncbi:MAG: DUF2232 domain-containing protein [Clostridiales bacterium]|nr:DUF2232 domain-containing protein [Clostridiales bacterium]
MELILSNLILSSGILGIFIALVIAALIPAVIIAVTHKKGYVWGGCIVLFLCSLTLFTKDIFNAIYVIVALVPIVFLSVYCMQNDMGYLRTILIGIFAYIVELIAVYFILNSRMSISLLESMDAAIEAFITSNPDIFEPLLKSVSEVLGSEISINTLVPLITDSVRLFIPTLLFILCAVLSAVSVGASSFIINKTSEKKVSYIPFSVLTISSSMGCFLFVAFAALMLLLWLGVEAVESIYILLIAIYFFIMYIQGLSTMYYFGRKFKIPYPVVILILVAASFVSAMAVLILGVVDNIMRLRHVSMYKAKLKEEVAQGKREHCNYSYSQIKQMVIKEEMRIRTINLKGHANISSDDNDDDGSDNDDENDNEL